MWRPRHGITLAAFGLLGLGLLMSQSAGLDVGRGPAITLSDILLGPSAIRALAAILLLAACSRLPIEWFGRPEWSRSPMPWITLAGLLLLAALLVPGVGDERKGAVRWIDVGPGFQPSELVKWSIPVAIAWWAARRGRRMERFGTGLLPALALVGACGVLIGKEDLGTAVVVTLVGVAVLLAGGARPIHLAGFVPIGGGLAALAIILEPYRFRRLLAFVDPYADPEGLNYHVVQSLAAIAGGGSTGRGLGNGTQKFGYLPEDTTDFVFAIICEELGVGGGLLTIGLLAIAMCACFGVVRRSRAAFDRLAVLGIAATFGLQALVNLLVVTGLAPTKGIALPLVSHGGTGWWVTAAALGFVCAADRRADRDLAAQGAAGIREPASAESCEPPATGRTTPPRTGLA